MKTLRPIFLSTYPPEQCGLATFTRDSADAVDLAAGQPVSSVIAIEKTHSLTNANGRVAHVIDNSQQGAYRQAANVVNEGPWDVVSIQHEFGLYSGFWGQDIMQFVKHCKTPIVSTPYLYAEEVLADGRGLLVPFSSESALADAVLRYLNEPELLADTRRRAYRYAQSMFWPHVGRKAIPRCVCTGCRKD